jgi:hypothetical protein
MAKKKEFTSAIFSRRGSVYLDRYTIKFCDYPFFLVYHNPECGIPAIVSNTMGNCHKRTGCGGDLLDMD